MTISLSIATLGRLKNRSPLSLATRGYFSTATVVAVFIPGNEFIWYLDKQNNTWTLFKQNEIWTTPQNKEIWILTSKTASWTLISKRALWTLFDEV